MIAIANKMPSKFFIMKFVEKRSLQSNENSAVVHVFCKTVVFVLMTKKLNIIRKGYTAVYSNYIVLNLGHTVTKIRGSEGDPRLMKEDT